MKKSQQFQWYQNEIEKDQKELNLDKQKLIDSLKGLDKKDIVSTKIIKLTLWQRIKKVLGF